MRIMNPLIDTHCHLNSPDFAADLPDVLRRACEAGVERLVCVGYDMESSVRAVELANEFAEISAVVGIHPHDADTLTPEAEDQLRSLASNRGCVVGIGETGLDYYRNLSPREVQQQAFRRHIRLAQELELPLVIHSRDAGEDVLNVLREEGMPARGVVMHCMPGDADFARGSIELGCYVGIDGPVTFKNAQVLYEIVGGLPIERILLETDCPYLTPHPYRGKRNEPSYLPLIAAKVAEAQGLTVEEVSAMTTANARKLFGLD